MTLTDRYGLAATTASPVALEQFQAGMDRVLSYGPGAEECFASALEADEALAVAHAGRALHAAEFPRDALLVNQASSAIGLGGRSDREEHRAAFLERLAPAYGDDWWRCWPG